MLDDPRLVHEIPRLLERVAAEELLPRLANAAANARMKGVGEVVTDADLAAEAALTTGLHALTPGAVIVGEESAHADSTLLEGLEGHPAAWLVDPLDGSRHFAAGAGPFGIMLALLRAGTCEAAWIYLPLTGDLGFGRRGAGAWLNGVPVQITPVCGGDTLRGGLLTRFFPEAMRTRAEATTDLERTDRVHHCAAQRYMDLLRGGEHFAAYWRTLPWDHAPGVLLVEEAGGVARRFDGRAYDATDVRATGLLVASDRPTWDLVRSRVVGLDEPGR